MHHHVWKILVEFYKIIYLFCRHHTVDMCVAVATDNGLITPIVKSAERKVSIILFVLIPYFVILPGSG